jgi:hypothetical protein
MWNISLLLLAATSVAACSNGSPMAPSPDSIVSAERPGGEVAAPGVYELSFRSSFPDGKWKEVSTLPVGRAELVIRAHVTDSSGRPATAGSITIQYCSYGGPAGDINRPDEAPMEACADGTATWVRHTSRSVTAGGCPEFSKPELSYGYVCANFGIVRIPRTVGFRAQYQPKSSSIAAGTTAPKDFTWY